MARKKKREFDPNWMKGFLNEPIFTKAQMKDLPSREEIINAFKPPKQLPPKPKLTKHRQNKVGHPDGIEHYKWKPGIMATAVAILLRSGKDGVTLEELVDELHEWFPRRNRQKMLATMKNRVLLGRLPNGKSMKVTRKANGRHVVDPASVPGKIGIKPPAFVLEGWPREENEDDANP